MAFDIDNKNNRNRFNGPVFYKQSIKKVKDKIFEGVQKEQTARSQEYLMKMIEEAMKQENECKEDYLKS
jgi:aspartate/glutamate racemase